MILLYPQDAAKCYDDLSILAVKARKPRPDRTVEEAIERVSVILVSQLGADKHADICRSPEYQRLIDLNQWLFDEFEWLHTEGTTADPEVVKARAIETDRVNGVDRPAAKRALQQRWFGAALTEVKLGYGGLQ